MKKIAFALEVFTLMTMLPLCVIVEMNHSTLAATEKNTVKKFGENTKIIPGDYSSIQGYKMKILFPSKAIIALY